MQVVKNKKKPRPRAALPKTAAQFARWRQMAAEIWAKHPTKTTVEVAWKIQRSASARKREDSAITYSVAYISKAIVSIRRDHRPR
jgi:hypothetical protein